jgi:predicted DNA-binding transcriptional regulator AlpA
MAAPEKPSQTSGNGKCCDKKNKQADRPKADNSRDSLPVEEQKERQESEEDFYSLAASREGLGELTPVLVDVHGDIIDGFHRRKENSKWHAITVPHIDNPIKLELARLAVNFARRKVPDEELTQRVTFLRKAGLTAEEIAKKTGIGRSTIFKHIPKDLKDPKKVDAGKVGGLASSAPRVDQTVTTSDNVPRGTPMEPEHDDLVEALDEAKQPTCPECQEEPVHAGEELPWVLCSKGHEWNLNTGSLREKEPRGNMVWFVKCSGCHLSVDSSKIENGLCDVCRQKATAQTTATPPPTEQEPTHEDTKQAAAARSAMKPTKPVNYNALGEFCPICGCGISKEKFERLKAKFGEKYPGLFAKPIEEKEKPSANPFDDEN